MKDTISKKELLQITGISYGQLYRWKRENLIPEEWFMKQSAFTGQETFFPREKILKRIEIIQELKDSKSLEEIAALVSPELTNRLFRPEDLNGINELDKKIAECFKAQLEKDTFSYLEVLMMYAFSILKRENEFLPDSGLQNLIHAVKDWSASVSGTSYSLVILEMENTLYALLHPLQAQVLLDSRFKVLRVFQMDEISNDIKLKYDRRD